MVTLAAIGSAYISPNSPSPTPGVDPLLLVGNFKFGAQPETPIRGLLRFDIPDAFAGLTLLSASLVLTRTAGGTFGTATQFTLNRLTQIGWVATESTWADYAAGMPWASAGGDFTATGAAATTVAVADSQATFDVAGLVADAIALREGKLELLLKSSVETGGSRYLIFHSSNAATPADRPQLLLEFENSPAYGEIRIRPSIKGRVRVAPKQR